MSFTQLFLFLPAAAIVAASPGPNNLLAFSNGSRYGFLPAVSALTGRCVAFALMIIVVIMGLGAALQASEIAFQAIKWAGVVYLAYLGVQMIANPQPQTTAGGSPTAHRFALARREFMVATTNPKAVLLFTAFVPQFIMPGSTSSFAAQLGLLGATYVAVEFFAAMGWAFAGSVIRSMQPSIKRMTQMNQCTGALMIGSAGLLALTKRS
jgi:threonine/homoserine/homoserine lactone efflux protein